MKPRSETPDSAVGSMTQSVAGSPNSGTSQAAETMAAKPMTATALHGGSPLNLVPIYDKSGSSALKKNGTVWSHTNLKILRVEGEGRGKGGKSIKGHIRLSQHSVGQPGFVALYIHF